MKKKFVWTALMILCMAMSAEAQVKNPTGVLFQCPDHDRDSNHEVDIVDDATGNVIQTIQAGDPPADTNGDVLVTLNVQPIAFGNYTFVVRAVAGTLKSEDSTPSDVWSRVPGKPTKPVVQQ